MRLTPLAAALAAGLFALPSTSADAATIAVEAGGCTLIDAIIAANSNTATGDCPAGSGADTIVLPKGSTQTLTAVNNALFGDTGLPVINSTITLVGNDSTIARAPGAPNFRILAVNTGGNLSLKRTTLSGGVTVNSGGAIYNRGTVGVTESTVAGNVAGVYGGGIVNLGGLLTLTRSTVSGNFSVNAGGGIITTSGSLTLTNSTLSGNTGSGNGGGISGNNTHITLTDSTITGNNGGSYGGGALLTGGTLILDRSLISGNTVTSLGAELLINGASVDANNFNLFGNLGNAGIFDPSSTFTPGATDIVPAAALVNILGSLAGNGGHTLTHALAEGSPARNAAGAACSATDQRGVNRPKGPACDIGAYEAGVNTADLSILKTASDESVLVGDAVTFTLAITNDGPENATDVQVVDGLPTPLGFGTATPTQGSCVFGLGTLTCNLGGLASGASASISLVTTASTPGTAVNTASVISAPVIDFDPDTVDNDATSSVVIEAVDTTPDQFLFTDQMDVPLNSLRTSNAVTITGINTPATISVTGGMFSIGCTGSFTDVATTIGNGQSVCVQHMSSGNFSTETDTILTIGGMSGTFDTFTSTTLAADTTPDLFTFTDQTNVPRNSARTSNTVTITGINTAAPISVMGGMFSIGCNGTFTAAATTITSGQSVCVKHTSSGSFSANVDTVLTIGGVSDTFRSTTLAADTTPNAFTFMDQTNVPRNSARTSNAVTISGINTAAPISVLGGGYSIGCTGTFTTAAGTINSGQTVCVRHMSSASFNAGVNTVLTVGGISDTFSSVTTKSAVAQLLGVVFTIITGLVGTVLGILGL
ncbi:MAG: choice-of-anchor Q domain-containing protein [Panacagrimonas sp.]